MAIDQLRRLLDRAKSSGSPGGASIHTLEVQEAWIEALRPEDGTASVSPQEAALLESLWPQPMDAMARGLLGQILSQGVPALLRPGAQPAPASGGQPALPSLTGHGGAAVQILPTGVLRIAQPATSDATVEAAALLVLRQVEEGQNPFAGISDAGLLERVDQAHARLFREIENGSRLGAEAAVTQRHGRAAALATARLAALRLCELRPEAQPRLGQLLIRLAGQEPHLPLRQFEIQRLLESPLGSVPEVTAASEVVFPRTPPYEAWRRDGVLRAHFYCDNDGAPWRDQARILTGMGMRVSSGSIDDPTRPVTFTKDVTGQGGGFRRIEVTLAPSPAGSTVPSLFEHMGDEEVDVILYSGHAGYGQRVDAALRSGVQTSGAGKLIMLFQCWGIGNLESIGRAFPEAQVFSTTDSSTAWSDDVAIARAFDAFARGRTWEQLLGDLPYDAQHPDSSGYKKLYFAPSSRQIVSGRLDHDQDGSGDATDPVYLEPRANELLRSATSWNPVRHDVPTYALSGQVVQDTTDAMSRLLRYNALGLSPRPPGLSQALPLGPELVVSGGFFSPRPGELEAFRFEPVMENGQPRVRLLMNADFAHADSEELANFAAFELGKTLARWAGKSPAEQVAYGMACYLKSIHQHNGTWESYQLLESEELEHQMFLRRYGLPALGLHELSAMLPGEHPDLTAANLAPLVQRLGTWAGTSDGSPRRIGQAATTSFSGSVLEPQSVSYWPQISEPRVTELVQGVPGLAGASVVSTSWRGGSVQGPLVIHVREASGQPRILVADVDTQSGRLRSLYDLGTQIDPRRLAIQGFGEVCEKAAGTIFPSAAGRGEKVAQLVRQLQADLAAGRSLSEILGRASLLVQNQGGSRQGFSSTASSHAEPFIDGYGQATWTAALATL